MEALFPEAQNRYWARSFQRHQQMVWKQRVGRGRNGKELGEADCSESIQVSGNAAGVAPDDGISRIKFS